MGLSSLFLNFYFTHFDPQMNFTQISVCLVKAPLFTSCLWNKPSLQIIGNKIGKISFVESLPNIFIFFLLAFMFRLTFKRLYLKPLESRFGVGT